MQAVTYPSEKNILQFWRELENIVKHLMNTIIQLIDGLKQNHRKYAVEVGQSRIYMTLTVMNGECNSNAIRDFYTKNLAWQETLEYVLVNLGDSNITASPFAPHNLFTTELNWLIHLSYPIIFSPDYYNTYILI